MRRVATAGCVAGMLLAFSSASAGAATLAPTSADFGTQPIGGVSDPKVFTLTPELLDILPLTVATTGQFKQTNSCGALLQFVNGPCTISVTFAPTDVGNHGGSLTTTVLGGPSASLRGTATTGSGAGANANKGATNCKAAGKKKKRKGKKQRAATAKKQKKGKKKRKGCKKKGKKKRKGKKK